MDKKMDSGQMEFYNIQKNMRNNTEDVTRMVSDLKNWSSSMNKTEKTRVTELKQKQQTNVKKQKDLPPIRNKININESLAKTVPPKKGAAQKENPQDKAKKVRDTTPMLDYYKAWDKYAKDVEDQDSSDDDASVKQPDQIKFKASKEPTTQAEMMALTSGAKPNTQIVIKGGLRKQVPVAEEFKSQGNSYFVSLEYSKATECYSRCLDAIANHPSSSAIENPDQMRMLTYSNRAQAYLKLKAYPKAFQDAQKAVELDPTHVKSIGRRGTAAFYLGKTKLAMKDFVAALNLDPQNAQFRQYLHKTQEKLQKIKSEAYERMQRRVQFTNLDQIGFEDHASQLYVAELHLDQKQAAHLTKKKDEVIAEQQERKQDRLAVDDKSETTKTESSQAAGDKKKKKKKSKKNKGLKAFMDCDNEMAEYLAEAAEEKKGDGENHDSTNQA